MTRRRLSILVLLVVVAVSTVVLAGSGTPLTAFFLLPDPSNGAAFGVYSDFSVLGGSNTYANGSSGVQCYFGVAGKDLDLVTYNTGRKLVFHFDPSSAAVIKAVLPTNLPAEADFYGVNFYGPYRTQGDGTTAQVQASLQFHYGTPPRTYELAYPALAAYRLPNGGTPGNTWLITSDLNDIPGNPGFTASNLASLNQIRKKGSINYGAVNMPIRFQVTLQ